MATLNMASFSHSSFVRGYHDYLNIWSPQIGEILEVKEEPNNTHDTKAVAVMKDEEVVGHLPKSISGIVFYFLLREDSAVTCEVTGSKLNRGVVLD